MTSLNFNTFATKPKRARRSRSKRGPIDMSDEARHERAYAACIFGNPLNGDVYDPHENQMLPETGAWVMIRRQLPPIERGVDKQVTIGRVFWSERLADSDEEGFRPDGTYKVRCLSPFGELCLWPYEYVTMDPKFLISAWQEGAIKFHPTGIAESQFNDQVFYCMSRGISRADAVVMSLGTMTGPIGWFEPDQEIVEFVTMFENVGAGIQQVNKQRRNAQRRKARA